MAHGRWHITGASGSGVTTLGRALAQALAVPTHDTDDYYWLPTDPPYTAKRPVPDRLALMDALFLPRRAWVLSGSLAGWGDPLIPHFDRVVFLTVETETRIARLRDRESRRHGVETLETEGTKAFLAWAQSYDDPSFTGRSRAIHDAWLDALPCPVLRLDSSAPPARLLQACLDWPA